MSIKINQCEELCSDIRALHIFLASQAKLIDIGPIQSKQCDQLCTRIGGLSYLDFTGATSITELLLQGPWTVDQKSQLANQVQLRLGAGDHGSGQSRQRRKNQTIHNFQAYLTANEIETLSDPDISNLFASLISNTQHMSVEGCFVLTFSIFYFSYLFIQVFQ